MLKRYWPPLSPNLGKAIRTLTLDDTLLDEDLLEDLHTALDLLFAVSSHQCEANERVLRSTCGRDDGVDERSNANLVTRNVL